MPDHPMGASVAVVLEQVVIRGVPCGLCPKVPAKTEEEEPGGASRPLSRRTDFRPPRAPASVTCAQGATCKTRNGPLAQSRVRLGSPGRPEICPKGGPGGGGLGSSGMVAVGWGG